MQPITSIDMFRRALAAYRLGEEAAPLCERDGAWLGAMVLALICTVAAHIGAVLCVVSG